MDVVQSRTRPTCNITCTSGLYPIIHVCQHFNLVVNIYRKYITTTLIITIMIMTIIIADDDDKLKLPS